MRKAILLVFLAFAVACTAPKPGFRTGDIVFVGLPMDYPDSTGELNLIHVAILEMAPEGPMILESTLKRGVSRHPVDTMLRDLTLRNGGYPTFFVKRLKDGFDPQYLENAKALLGRPYDKDLDPDNQDYYCTEYIQKAYRRADGTPLFPNVPLDFRKPGSEDFPPYWVRIFGLIGHPIPQGEPGTTPQDICDSPLLEPVDADFFQLMSK